ncbi:MAG: hypothetical protein Q9175_007488, partial [Cornicularia normoerica]
MDSASAHSGQARHLAPTNSTDDKSLCDTSNHNSSANKTRQTTISVSTIDAHFAKLARERKCSSGVLSSNTSDRNREVYVNRQLVDRFGQHFGMSESHAKAAVQEEMRRR